MAAPKLTLSASRDIPFNRLVLSQSNVRTIKTGVSIEELAEDIARRTLLQSLSVRAVLDADGAETGRFEIPAGGRRYRALELLVKQKRLSKTAPVPCVVRAEGLAEEDSLAENVQRAPLHPLDQFRAFKTLRDKGLGDEEIAARFFVSSGVVKQRMRLASVSPKLLDVYAEDKMTMEQLMAFTVSEDHARQEQVWEALAKSYSRDAYQIRQMLTKDSVRANDPRAIFVGLEAYHAAGGYKMSRYSIAWPGRASNARPRPSAARAGSGSSWPRRFHQAMTVGCVACGASRSRRPTKSRAPSRQRSASVRRWKGSTPTPTKFPTKSVSVSTRSTRRSPTSRFGRFVLKLTKSPAPACS